MKTHLMLLLPCVLLACKGGHHDHHHHTPPVAEPRLVSIEVEVFDPITNFVWENVSVRIVEADNEWSGCLCVSPYLDWFLTDSNGRVFFDEFLIADAEVGLLEDGAGRAILNPSVFEDEVVITLEVDAVGFSPVFVDVLVTWDQPDVFVEVPFN